MGEVKHNNRAFDDLVAEMRRDHPSEMALAGEWAAGWADGVKHGAAQIDALRAERDALASKLSEECKYSKRMHDAWVFSHDQAMKNGQSANQLESEIAKLVATLVGAQKIINHQGWSANEQTEYDAIEAVLAKHRASLHSAA